MSEQNDMEGQSISGLVAEWIRLGAELRRIQKLQRETEWAKTFKDREMAPNEIRIGTTVVWAPNGVLEQFRVKTRDSIIGGLVAPPFDYPTEGTVVAIHPTLDIVTVRWPDESPRWGFARETRVIAGNLAVKGSRAACRESLDLNGMRTSKPKLIRDAPEVSDNARTTPEPEVKKEPVVKKELVAKKKTNKRQFDIPRRDIEWLMGRTHIATPDDEVRSDIERRAAGWPPEKREEAVRYALMIHNRNRNWDGRGQ